MVNLLCAFDLFNRKGRLRSASLQEASQCSLCEKGYLGDLTRP